MRPEFPKLIRPVVQLGPAANGLEDPTVIKAYFLLLLITTTITTIIIIIITIIIIIISAQTSLGGARHHLPSSAQSVTLATMTGPPIRVGADADAGADDRQKEKEK